MQAMRIIEDYGGHNSSESSPSTMRKSITSNGLYTSAARRRCHAIGRHQSCRDSVDRELHFARPFESDGPAVPPIAVSAASASARGTISTCSKATPAACALRSQVKTVRACRRAIIRPVFSSSDRETPRTRDIQLPAESTADNVGFSSAIATHVVSVSMRGLYG